MEFIVSRNALLQALNHCRHAIYIKRTYDIFKNFTFSFPDGQDPKTMTVHSSDKSQWLSETIAIEPAAASADAPGAFRPFSVYYYDMLRAINALDEQPLTIRVHEYQLSVHHSCGSFRMPLANVAQEFLDAPKPQPDADAEDGCRLEYEAPGLRSILSRCKYAMAQDELRPAMNGVYVNLTSDFSDYVSSDGHRLVRVRKDPMFVSTDESEAVSFIIPSAVVRTLLRILPKTGDVEIVYQKELLEEKMPTDSRGNQEKYTVVTRKAAASVIINDSITLSFYLVEGKYPRYWSVIPDRFNYEMTINRRQLIKSVDRIDIFSNETSGMMIFNISENRLNIEACDPDFELSGEEILDCEFKEKGVKHPLPFRIGLKATSMSQTLKALTSEEVLFQFVDHTRALIITPKPQPDVENVTMLLMPMLL